jgi:hypothetical protein
MLLGVAENDWVRLRGPLLSYTALGLLQLVALLRYPHTPDWHRASAWLYVAFLIAMVAVGGYSWYAMRRGTSRSSGAAGGAAEPSDRTGASVRRRPGRDHGSRSAAPGGL